jgi:molecular chaperone DnaK
MEEAQKYASEDKAHKEEIETFNHADSTIYQTEKTMRDMGDKISAADKATLESELEAFKKTRATNNAADVKREMETFTQKTYEIFGKIYQQSAGAQGGPQGGSQVNDDGTVDSNFTDQN